MAPWTERACGLLMGALVVLAGTAGARAETLAGEGAAAPAVPGSDASASDAAVAGTAAADAAPPESEPSPPAQAPAPPESEPTAAAVIAASETDPDAAVDGPTPAPTDAADAADATPSTDDADAAAGAGASPNDAEVGAPPQTAPADDAPATQDSPPKTDALAGSAIPAAAMGTAPAVPPVPPALRTPGPFVPLGLPAAPSPPPPPAPDTPAAEAASQGAPADGPAFAPESGTSAVDAPIASPETATPDADADPSTGADQAVDPDPSGVADGVEPAPSAPFDHPLPEAPGTDAVGTDAAGQPGAGSPHADPAESDATAPDAHGAHGPASSAIGQDGDVPPGAPAPVDPGLTVPPAGFDESAETSSGADASTDPSGGWEPAPSAAVSEPFVAPAAPDAGPAIGPRPGAETGAIPGPADPEPSVPASDPFPSDAAPVITAEDPASSPAPLPTAAAAPATAADAEPADAPTAPAWPDTAPALVQAAGDGRLGRAHLPTACAEPVQGRLDTALVLLHAGHVKPARNVLASAGQADATCTGVPIGLALAAWAQGGRTHVPAGQAALAQARALGARSGTESAWLEALGAYFDGDGRSDAVRRGALRERLRRWHEEQPDDDDIAVLYAASLLDPQPPGGAPARAQAIATAVLERTPAHAGAARTVLRAARARGDALAALTAAQAWTKAAPGSARAALAVAQQAAALGQHAQAAQAGAAAADLARTVDDAATAARAALVHADAAVQQCDSAGADSALEALKALGPYGAAPATWVRAAMALHAQDWSAAADLPVPTEPALAAAWAHAARAIGRAQLGETPEPDVPPELGADADAQVGAAISAVRLVVRASAAVQAGEGERALELYDAAAAFETRAGTALAPPVPAMVLKGRLLLTLSRPAEALAAFEQALTHPPNGRAALEGAQSAAQAVGDSGRAQAYQARLAPACTAGAEPPAPKAAAGKVSSRKAGRSQPAPRKQP